MLTSLRRNEREKCIANGHKTYFAKKLYQEYNKKAYFFLFSKQKKVLVKIN